MSTLPTSGSAKRDEMELVVDTRDDELAPKYKAASPYYEMMVYSPPKGALSPSSSVVGKSSPQEQFRKRFPTASAIGLADPCGNGDQSPVTNAADQTALLELFRVGGDFDEYLPNKMSSKKKDGKSLSELATHCVAGRYEKVKLILERHSPQQGRPWETLQEILERRETMLRLSPLLLVFCMLHKIGIVLTSASVGPSREELDDECNVTLHSYRHRCSLSPRSRSLHGKEAHRERTSYYGLNKERWLEYIGELEQNLVLVVVELLYHGANPCAKDVLGRTVCFYGASVYATARSLQATTMCIQAAKSAHCFGKEVLLQNMETIDGAASKKNYKYNGMRGLAAGYQVETARRIVYLFGKKSNVAVLNRNLCLVDDDTGIMGDPPSLCDIPDRLGRVCLVELLSPSSSQRLDVIRFLLHQHQASIDIPDWTGQTVQQISSVKLQECRRNAIPSTNAEVIAAREILAEAVKRARQNQKCKENTCSACTQEKSLSSSLQVCQHCMSVRYCSKECQERHWKDGGHRKECSKLRKIYNECIEIEAPLSSNSGATNSSFRKPSSVPMLSTFTLKVETVEDRIGGGSQLHLYDKDKECDFFIGKELPYTKLFEMVQAESLTAGAHAYVAASFDPTGKCKVFVNRRKIKTW